MSIIRKTFELLKGGKRAQIGEVRTWKGKKFQKVEKNKWQPLKEGKQEEEKTDTEKDNVNVKLQDIVNENLTEKKISSMISHVQKSGISDDKKIKVMQEISDSIPGGLVSSSAKQSSESVTKEDVKNYGGSIQKLSGSNVKNVLVSLDKISAEETGQIRKQFNKEALEELAQSIDENGLLQPITVRPDKNKEGQFKIVAGERRFRALNILKSQGRLKDLNINVNVIENLSEKDKDILQLIENNVREDNTPLELSDHYIKLTKEHKMTVAELAKKSGKSVTYISDLLLIGNLSPEIRGMLKDGSINKSVAVALGKVENHTLQARALNNYLRQNWKVNQLKAFMGELKNQPQFFGEDAGKDSTQLKAENELKEKKINPVEAQAEFGKLLGKHTEFLGKLLDKDGTRLSNSALALTATGDFNKTMKEMEIIQEQFATIMNQMKKQNAKLKESENQNTMF